MLEDKRFQNNETGEIVRVVSESGMFYSLNNGMNIKKDVFFQKFSESVDASSFFSSGPALSDMASKITQIDSSKVSDVPADPIVINRGEEGGISRAPQPDSREELIRKYNESQRKTQTEYKVYENEDDAADEFFRKQQQQQTPQRPRRRPEDGMDITNMDLGKMWPEGGEQFNDAPGATVNIPTEISGAISREEESFKFFRSFKRVYPIKLTIDFEEKIADPEFIKMMVMNFEGDIIKYYTNELMNRVYNDPGFLETKIYNKLRDLIMGESKPKTVRKPRAKKEAVKPPQTPPTPRSKKNKETNG